jgi:hypothetical protein
MTLERLGDVKEGPTMLGSMLFSRCCSGTRYTTSLCHFAPTTNVLT